jgi:hypothetical protein
VASAGGGERERAKQPKTGTVIPCRATVYGRSCLAVAVTRAGFCAAHDPDLKASRERRPPSVPGGLEEVVRRRQQEQAAPAKAPNTQQDSAKWVLFYEAALKRIAGLRCRCFVLVPPEPGSQPGPATAIRKGTHEAWCPVGIAKIALAAAHPPAN